MEQPCTQHQCVETQNKRWFIGAHSNVGGGYSRDLLAQVPLKWIQEGASDAGLEFRAMMQLGGHEHLDGQVVDSYRRFMKGIYRMSTFGRRHYRGIGRPDREVTKGFVETVNESIDSTVFDRWQKDLLYRPENLREWAINRQFDLDHEPVQDRPA